MIKKPFNYKPGSKNKFYKKLKLYTSGKQNNLKIYPYLIPRY